jgi:hypothetical protein
MVISWNGITCSLKTRDDDSNERDPFTDRSFDINNLSLDYALSDRDIRHKFNFITFAHCLRVSKETSACRRVRPNQSRRPRPHCHQPQHARKDNAYFSFDWRVQRPFHFGERYELIPIVEMFNTFNNKT